MKDLKMSLNIQQFAEMEDDSAANATEVDTDFADSEEDDTEVNFTDGASTSTVDTTEVTKETSKKQTTKDYSERLKADREKIRQEIEEQKKADLDAIAKSRGFSNWEELEDFDKTEKIKDLGVADVDKFQAFVDSVIEKNPKIKQADAIIAEQQKKDRERALEEQVTEINKLDNTIKTVSDLINHPRYGEILEKVKVVGSVTDAYKLVNFDILTGKQTESAVQDVYNNINSKAHLKTTTGGATKDIIVPADIMATYKANMRTWSDEQIKSHYAKSIGGGN